ncbi:hypothetical protein E4T43_03727 [Aureobasidium subglaciale]|nr:hypothetical protein E4T43_03727 [Aureobasidium subglaciale]
MAANVDIPTVIIPSEGLPTPPSHIFALPHELLSMTVSDCDPNDLKNIRLTSKLMYAISTKHFGRKKFARRRFLFTFESMEALLDITAHPIFGPYLKCITFGTHRMAPWNDCELEDEYSDDPNVLHDQIDHKHQKFIHCNDHVKMLVLSLENLTRCGNTEVVLGIHDDIHGIEVRRPGYAFKASYRGYPLEIVDPRDTIDAVTEAVSRSKYAIKVLKLCLSSSSYSLRSLSYTKMKILSNATRLELSRYSFNRAVPQERFHIFDQLSHGELWDAVDEGLQSLIEEAEEMYGDESVVLKEGCEQDDSTWS